MPNYDREKLEILTLGLFAAALLAALPLGLLPALLAGLLVYNTVVFGAKGLVRWGVFPDAAKVLLIFLISFAVISLFSIAGIKLVAFLGDDPESIVGLMKHLAHVINSERESFPIWIREYLPSNIEGWQTQAYEWLINNAKTLSAMGRSAGMGIIYMIFGMLIGGLAAMHSIDVDGRAPLTRAIDERAGSLGRSFRHIVFSQIRISAFNTFLTGVFLIFVMPVFGYDLPLVKTMIVVTFVVGLLPIIGNIISNTVIFVIALGVSFGAAICALVFLILIHKLEYFVNAKIIGSRINAHAWEILSAMLVMEAMFGLSGLVAAPIYYAYIKEELASKKLI